MKKVLEPYREKVVKEKGLPNEQKGIIILDLFKANYTQPVLDRMKLNFEVVFVPAGMTDLLQPMDLAVNKPLKDGLKKRYGRWYQDQIEEQVKSGIPPEKVLVDLRLSSIKALHLQWVYEAWAGVEKGRYQWGALLCVGNRAHVQCRLILSLVAVVTQCSRKMFVVVFERQQCARGLQFNCLRLLHCWLRKWKCGPWLRRGLLIFFSTYLFCLSFFDLSFFFKSRYLSPEGRI